MLVLIFLQARNPATARKVHELLELFPQSKLGDTDRTRDAEECERESKTVVFVSALLALLVMLVWLLTVKVWFGL